jgi:hypothetical protein
LKRHVFPALGVRAGSAAGALDPVGLVPCHLIVYELARLDQRPGERLFAVIVEAGGPEGAGCGLLGLHVDDLTAELIRPELVGSQEAGAGEVGLHAEGTVELRRVPQRFVDGEPEVGRVQDQIALSGRYRGRAVFGPCVAGRLAHVVVPGVVLDVFIAEGARARVRATRLEAALFRVDRGQRKARVQALQRLLDQRALARRKEFVLAHAGQLRIDKADAGLLHGQGVDG